MRTLLGLCVLTGLLAQTRSLSQSFSVDISYNGHSNQFGLNSLVHGLNSFSVSTSAGGSEALAMAAAAGPVDHGDHGSHQHGQHHQASLTPADPGHTPSAPSVHPPGTASPAPSDQPTTLVEHGHGHHHHEASSTPADPGRTPSTPPVSPPATSSSTPSSQPTISVSPPGTFSSAPSNQPTMSVSPPGTSSPTASNQPTMLATVNDQHGTATSTAVRVSQPTSSAAAIVTGGSNAAGAGNATDTQKIRFEEHVTSTADLIVAIDERDAHKRTCYIIWVSDNWADYVHNNDTLHQMTVEIFDLIMNAGSSATPMWELSLADLGTYLQDDQGQHECVGHTSYLLLYTPSFITSTAP